MSLRYILVSGMMVMSTGHLTPTGTDPTYRNLYRIHTDATLLSTAIFGECSVCDDAEKRRTGSVVLNRLRDGRWGKTLHDVIYAPGQFDSVCGDNWNTDHRHYTIAKELIYNGPTDSSSLYFAQNKSFFKRFGIKILGRERFHIFGR